MVARFLQCHTLTSYSASLLNRDDLGFAKRIPFGNAERTRISSQCLKRHWRTADDENALHRIRNAAEDGGETLSIRSRRTFEKHLYEPLKEQGVDPDVAAALSRKVLETLLPEGKRKSAARAKADQDEEAKEKERATDLHTEQVTVIGRPEMKYLCSLARRAVAEATDAGDAKAAVKAFDALNKGELKKNLQALKRGAGLDAALFGRMTTGDVLARCDAAIHVAHAFTVHKAQVETDYFSALDDLQGREETGSGHINTAELTTGLFYGYVVVDLPLLVSNLEGCERGDWLDADRNLAGEVVRRFLHLMTTVSPGAKLGATAPYTHSCLALVETGSQQPRTLANAFLKAVPTRDDLVQSAYSQLADYLQEHEKMYGHATERRFAAMEPPESLASAVGDRLDLPALANWVADVARGTA